MDDGEHGTKEMRESKLKSPKTMRDMLVVLSRSFPAQKKALRTFGYIMMGNVKMVFKNALTKRKNLTIGKTVSLAVMDNPAGNVCRISRSLRYPMPELASGFVARGIPLLMLHLQVKEMMSSMISQLNTCPPSKIQLGKALPVADLSFSIISSPSPSSASSRSTSSSSCISSDNSSSTSNRKRKLSAVIP